MRSCSTPRPTAPSWHACAPEPRLWPLPTVRHPRLLRTTARDQRPCGQRSPALVRGREGDGWHADAVRQIGGTAAVSGLAQPGGADGAAAAGPRPVRQRRGGAAAVLAWRGGVGEHRHRRAFRPGRRELGIDRRGPDRAGRRRPAAGLAVGTARSRARICWPAGARQPRRAGLLLAAAAVGGYQLCFFSAVRLTGVAIGTVVAIGSAPVFTGALSRLTGGPRLDRRWMVATAAAVAAARVLVDRRPAPPASALAGVGLALAAGLCYAVYAVAAARLITPRAPETRRDGPAVRRCGRAAGAGARGQLARLAAHRRGAWPSPPTWASSPPSLAYLLLRPRAANRACPGGGDPGPGRAGRGGASSGSSCSASG